MHNTIQNIIDDASELKKYQRKGYKLVNIPARTVKDIALWCNGHSKENSKKEK